MVRDGVKITVLPVVCTKVKGEGWLSYHYKFCTYFQLLASWGEFFIIRERVDPLFPRRQILCVKSLQTYNIVKSSNAQLSQDIEAPLHAVCLRFSTPLERSSQKQASTCYYY